MSSEHKHMRTPFSRFLCKAGSLWCVSAGQSSEAFYVGGGGDMCAVPTDAGTLQIS